MWGGVWVWNGMEGVEGFRVWGGMGGIGECRMWDSGYVGCRKQVAGTGWGTWVGCIVYGMWGCGTPPSPTCHPPGPTQRPKLNLKPRSAPKEEESTAAPAPQSSRAASIFGGAKPVDTAAREREVEERLQKEQEKLQRQLEDDKRLERRPRERWGDEALGTWGGGGHSSEGCHAEPHPPTCPPLQVPQQPQ